MKVKLLFDHPDSYREWAAWPAKEPGFLRLESKFWIAKTEWKVGRPELHHGMNWLFTGTGAGHGAMKWSDEFVRDKVTFWLLIVLSLATWAIGAALAYHMFWQKP